MKNKKILITILLCSILFSLFVPLHVSADSTYKQYKYGSTVLTDINTVYGDLTSSHPYVVITRSNNKYYLYASASKFNVEYTSSYYIKSNGQAYKWTYTDGQWESRVTFDFTYNSINFSNESLIWSNTDLIYSGNVYYTASAPIPLVCDGSSCPASDVDKDNVCDDCGMPFSNPRDYTVYKTYGTVTLPDIDTVWTDKTTYTAMAIYKINSTGDYRLCIGTAYEKDYCFIDEVFGSSYYRIGPNFKRYDLVGNVWTLFDEGNGSMITLTDDAELVWTSHPIYTDESHTELFFHKASSLVNSLTAKTMTGVMTQVLMILPIGLLCLIGYLALRKGLKLLVQVLRTA